MNRPLHFIILTGLLVSIAICAVLSENQMAELLEQPSELGPSILELYLAPFGNKDVGKGLAPSFPQIFSSGYFFPPEQDFTWDLIILGFILSEVIIFLLMIYPTH